MRASPNLRSDNVIIAGPVYYVSSPVRRSTDVGLISMYQLARFVCYRFEDRGVEYVMEIGPLSLVVRQQPNAFASQDHRRCVFEGDHH